MNLRSAVVMGSLLATSAPAAASTAMAARLMPGSYRVLIGAVDAAGNVSKSTGSVGFKIVRK